jgi:hypothetical protein
MSTETVEHATNREPHLTRLRDALALWAGANAMKALREQLHAKSEADLEAYYALNPNPEDTDGRDYRGLVQLVQASLDANLQHPDPAHREGFLRALTDLLCIEGDGCGIDDADEWDPIRNTARSFEAPA